MRAERQVQPGDGGGREVAPLAAAPGGPRPRSGSQEPLSADTVLALQRAAGNRVAGRALGKGTRRRLARAPSAIAPPQALGLRQYSVTDVDRAITETISHAPAAFAAWNNTFNWRSKWRLRLTTRPDPMLEVIVRLHCTASAAQKRTWENAITAKWDNRFSFCVKQDPMPARASGAARYSEAYPIRAVIAWVDTAAGADYTVTANAPGANEGGRSGVGGTTSMTGWGTADTTDITHEFGHILGCAEEYFTTNGVDYAARFGGVGFRARGGGVMNNPAGPALARNFDIIRQEAATLRGVSATRTEVA